MSELVILGNMTAGTAVGDATINLQNDLINASGNLNSQIVQAIAVTSNTQIRFRSKYPGIGNGIYRSAL